jgi:Domain of unknown function (DUF4407)
MVRSSPTRRKLSRLRRVLSVLGGADSQILAMARVDAAEMTGRGLAALIPAVFGGLAALISFRYAYTLPLGVAAAVGAGWAVVVLCFDLSLMTAAPDRRPVSRAVTFGSRAIVSVLAAFTFASAIVMFMFAKDIAVQVAKDQQTDLARYNNTVIVPAHAAEITTNHGTITTDQAQINQASQTVVSWQQKVASAELQVTCEAQGVSQFAGCAEGTALSGQGPVYAVRLAELHNDQAALARAQAQAAATKARLSPQIASAQASLTQAKQQEQADYANAQARYGKDDGLIARWRALSELESASPGIRTEVWLLEGLIIAIDLAAVIAKMTSKTPSYNRVLEAKRKKVALRAAMNEEDAADAIDLRRAGREARASIHQAVLDTQAEVVIDVLDAWKQVQQWRIRAWVEEQTGGQQPPTSDTGRWQPPPPRDGGRRGSDTAGATPVKGNSLSRLVDDMRPHEQMPVPMAPPLTRVAWIGTGLLSALGASLFLAQAAHATVAGGWLVLPVLVAALALAIYSRGFRRGPAWAHRAAFNTGLLGLALPVVIILMNI